MSDMQLCAACQKRGKTWDGDDPKCAFAGGSPFLPNNWGCATLGQLRDVLSEALYDGIVHERVTVREGVRDSETKHAMIDLYDVDGLSWDEATCLWVSWYKRRGCTKAVHLLGDEGARPPTESDIVLICKAIAEEQAWAASPEGTEWRKKYAGGKG